MKRAMYIDNISIVYDDEFWNKEQSINKRRKLAAVSVLFSLLLIALFTVLIKLTHNIMLDTIICLPVVIITKLVADMIATNNLYGDECVSYRAIDWFSEQSDIKAVIRGHEVYIETKNGNTMNLQGMLFGMKCLNRINYEDKFSLADTTPIRIVIDTTRKSVAEINVYVISNNDTDSKIKSYNDF